MRKTLVILFLLAVGLVKAQVPIIAIGKTENPIHLYRIIIPGPPNDKEYKAAKVLQHYIEEAIGYRIEIYTETEPRAPVEIVLNHPAGRDVYFDPKNLEPDEFALRTSGTSFYITGGSHQGLLYGVYKLLEKYVGCRFYAPGVSFVQKKEEIRFPEMSYKEKPAFQSREVYYEGMADDEFAEMMAIDRNAWKNQENWGMWVHTMFRLVPPEKYFDTHPEYYALVAGKRSKTQLCLTNPDVLRITIEELGKMITANPGAKYWSVSQMDTYGACECDGCKAIEKQEGSPSGVVIDFVNKVAAAFPDKVISTLAYQYTRHAPLHVKPASNVNIMLCTIECDRAKPIDSDTTQGSFYADLRDWSKITKNILVWDYVIQFTNMIAPFPNFAVLQPNIRMFKKFGVTGVFEQGCHGTYSENQELRQYVLAKLLWNPDINMDSLVNDFCRGYYGNASGWIRKYNREMENAQAGSGLPLLIYGSPAQETSSFLGSDLLKKYDNYFDEAEFSVTLDPAALARVKKARLPLRYAKLEIARKNITGPDGFLDMENGKWVMKKSFTDDLDAFTTQANLYEVRSIHEGGLTPDQYKENVLSSAKNAFTPHLALNKPYTLANPPGPKYPADGDGSLTDGKRGFGNYHILWQGFEGEDFEMTVDLGTPTSVRYVGVEFLQDITSWIFLPLFVTFSCSDDGTTFRELAKVDNPVDPKEKDAVIHLFDKKIPSVKTRYIRVFAKSVITCPDWHIGHGGKAWVFVDEVMVNK